VTDPDAAGPSADRRAVLALLGAAASPALAGCQTDSSTANSPDEGNDPGNATGDQRGDADASSDENDDADASAGEADDRNAWTVETDVPYRETPQRTLRADVYRPADIDAPPVVVHAHGGAWRFGDKGFRPLFGRLAAAAYATVDIQYRLSHEATYPGPVRDVAGAVRWVRATADERGIDPSRVALAGYSAGGHLAGLAATAPDLDAIQLEGFYPDVDPTVDAFVGNAGVYDFTAEGYGNAALIRQFLGGSRGARPDRYEQASPISHVDADAPPALLCHGTADRIVPFEQSERFAAALDDAGVPVERLTVDGAGHLFYTADRRLDAIADAQIEFLDGVVK